MEGIPVVESSSFLTAPVHINVGGVSYTSTLETLTRFRHSKIAKYFNGGLPVSVDPRKQQYFFDRDGNTFRHILNFLRNSKLVLPENFGELKLLMEEATYFEIEDMCVDIKRLIEEKIKPPNLEDEEKNSETESETISSNDESRSDNISQISKRRKKKKKNKTKCSNLVDKETSISSVDQGYDVVLKPDNESEEEECNSSEDNQPDKIPEPDQDVCDITTTPSTKDHEMAVVLTNILDEIKNINDTLGSKNSELVSASKETLAALNNLNTRKYKEMICLQWTASYDRVELYFSETDFSIEGCLPVLEECYNLRVIEELNKIVVNIRTCRYKSSFLAIPVIISKFLFSKNYKLISSTANNVYNEHYFAK